jgi:putative zinc finger protein
MIPYVGCEFARDHLDAFVDGELSVAEQVAVESHLRWCRTCAARVEDLRLIGDSIRGGSPVQTLAHEDARAVSDVHASVLMRIRTERELAFRSRLRDMFTDMRLLWPAIGATAAVFVCVCVAAGVLLLASRERPESLARMIDTLSNPGTESNPLRPGNTATINPYFEKYLDSNRSGGISIPRVLMSDDGAALSGMANQETMFAVAAVVNRDGRVSTYELLSSERMGEPEKPVHANDVAKMLDVVRQSRFEPAQTSLGRPVAVNMVWLMVVTTVQTPPAPRASAVRVSPAVARPPAAIVPPESLEGPPVKRSELAADSTTA